MLSCLKQGRKLPAPRHANAFRSPSPSLMIFDRVENRMKVSPSWKITTPAVRKPVAPKKNLSKKSANTLDQPPCTHVSISVGMIKGHIHVHASTNVAWPSSRKLKYRHIVFLECCPAIGFPGRNSSKPMIACQGRSRVHGVSLCDRKYSCASLGAARHTS